MESPPQGRWSGPGGPHDFEFAVENRTHDEALPLRRPPILSLPAAAGEGLKKTTPNGPNASPRTCTASSARCSPSDSCGDFVHEDDASPATEKQRYARLREEAAKQGMKMLEEEKERNREMTDLLQAQIKQLESELESVRSRLGKKCADYEEVLSMANEIALAYEHRSTRGQDTRDQAVQTDPRIWREYRQLSSATPYTLPVKDVKVKTQACGEDRPLPETPDAESATTTQTPRLAMLLPCSRPRRSYPPDGLAQSAEHVSNSDTPSFQSHKEIRGVSSASDGDNRIKGFQSALEQMQTAATAVAALLSPRGAQRPHPPSQCLSPRSTL